MPLPNLKGIKCKIMLEVSLSRLNIDVQEVGFHLFNELEDLPVTSLAAQLGHSVPSVAGRAHTDVLTPQARDDARTGTLSAIHGEEAFPFHTDTAHWKNPVDWVILKCVNPGAGKRGTLLIDGWGLGLENDDVKALALSLMVVKSGSRSFLAPPIEKERRGLLFRYDPACMNPAFTSGRRVLDTLRRRLDEANQQEVRWEAGQCLIFDNRRMLHARASSSVVDADRQLERIYIVR